MTKENSRDASFADAAHGRSANFAYPLISEVPGGDFAGVSVSGIRKQAGTIDLLNGVSFDVPPGECFGILGENGSGKTTLLRVITGLAFPSAGTVTISGHDPHADPVGALGNMSALIGIPAFYPYLGAYDNLRLFWRENCPPDRARIMAALEVVGLANESGKKVGAFSRGMLQRLGVALVVMQDRPLAVFDEPTQGVDVVWVEKLAGIFREMAAKGKALLITSHDFDFITGLCGNILILDKGIPAYRGSLNEIVEFPYYFHLRVTPLEKAAEVLKRLGYVHKAIRLGDSFELTMKDSMVSALIAALVDAGCEVHECACRRYSISDLIAQRRASGPSGGAEPPYAI